MAIEAIQRAVRDDQARRPIMSQPSLSAADTGVSPHAVFMHVFFMCNAVDWLFMCDAGS